MESIIFEETEKKEIKACFPGFGIVCCIFSSAVFSFNSVIVKMVDLHPTQVTLSRCAVQFLILLPVLQRKYKTVDITGPRNLRVLLWVRGFSGSLAGMFYFFAIKELSVGNAATISYLNIIIVPFVARIFLKEQFAVLDIIFALAALCGVVLIAKPTFIFPNQDVSNVTSIIGVVYALLAAISMALSVCIVRKLGPVTYPPLNVLYYSFCGSLMTFTILVIIGEFRLPCQHELPLVFIIGCLGLIAQLLFTLALKTEKAGTVSILGSIKIIMIYVAQIAFFGDIPSVLSLVGTLFILLCSLGIGIRMILNEKRRLKKNKQKIDRESSYVI